MMDAMKSEIRSWAAELGFDQIGFCAADRWPEDEQTLLRWIASGKHAGMGYLARHAARRADPRGLLAEARSLVVALAAYPDAGRGSAIASYALLRDYHMELSERLARLLLRIQDVEPAATGTVCVDTRPLLERRAAAAAGLGWVGKSTMLLNTEHGPWFMLGVLILSLDLPPDRPQAARCGTCTACLDACPTNALSETGGLDSRRCLSYWSIEHRGPSPEAIREANGERLFGCDECLRACPFGDPGARPPDPLLRDASELAGLTPERLLELLEQGFNRHFKRFALSRAGKAGLIRNALTALGNSGSHAQIPLVKRYLAHDNEGVRSHAFWALKKLEQC